MRADLREGIHRLASLAPEGLTFEQIAPHLGIQPKLVGKYARRMADAGEVRLDGLGRRHEPYKVVSLQVDAPAQVEPGGRISPQAEAALRVLTRLVEVRPQGRPAAAPSAAQLAAQYGCSGRTARQILDELIGAGRLSA